MNKSHIQEIQIFGQIGDQYLTLIRKKPTHQKKLPLKQRNRKFLQLCRMLDEKPIISSELP